MSQVHREILRNARQLLASTVMHLPFPSFVAYLIHSNSERSRRINDKTSTITSDLSVPNRSEPLDTVKP